MLETIDARADLPWFPRSARDWPWVRKSSGVQTWKCPDRPPGVSLLEVTTHPDRGVRGRLEGNATALLYGHDAAVGSLTSDDLGPALDRFYSVTCEYLDGSPRPDCWDVFRLDPSVTFESDPLVSASLLASVRAFWRATSSRTVTDFGSTVTLRVSKHRSTTIYDKTAEAAERGVWAPPGLIRAETRFRPRKDRSAAFAAFRPTLALTDDDLEVIVSESDMLSTLVTKTAAAGVYGMAAMLVKGGASAPTALRLAAAAMIADELPGALDALGVAKRTAYGYKAETRKYLEAAGAADDLATLAGDVMADFTRFAAKDYFARLAAEDG